MKSILLALLLTTAAHAEPKIQNANLATPAYLAGAGGTNAQLLNTSNMWDNINSQLLNTTLGALVPNTRTISTTAPLTGGGNLSANRTIAIPAATDSVDGYLTAADHTAFAASSGAAISSLTGDVTATGPGAAAATLATVNGNVGSFTYGSFTVNAKGLITAAASGTAPVTSLTVASANGLGGSFTSSTTPVLTLTTSVSGSVCGNGTAFSACTATGTGNTVLATSPTIVTPTIAKLANLTTNGFVTTTSGDGTLVVQTSPLPVANTTVATQALSACSTAKTVDWSTGNAFTLTLTNSATCAITFSNAASGQSITINLTQPSSGGGTALVSWATTTKWPNGGTVPVITTGNSASDTCTIIYSGTDYRGSCVQAFQ